MKKIPDLKDPLYWKKPKLYVIVDNSLLGNRLLEDIVFMVINGGADIIQYRDKMSADGIFSENAERIKRLADKFFIPFIINDRMHIAKEISASGVHLGEGDMSPREARKKYGKKIIIGSTARNADDIKQAAEALADYCGVGSVFPSSTKQAPVIGLDLLKEAVRSSSLPLAAIGGINAENITDVLSTGCSAVCVSSAIIKSDDPEEYTYNLKSAIDSFSSKNKS
ncbi:thiamine phosphate synthase [bacterium]|jgi:thiamine-phosphate pyrophosphorylase|nr:thiamine phosphate synthase [bacterium]